MDVIILAGGRGTRLSDKTQNMPKPLIDIGNKPIIWHIMKIYSHFQHNRFIVPLGYLGGEIKKYFRYYPWIDHDSGSEVDLDFKAYETPKIDENWEIILKDTGIDTNTQKRLYLVKNHIKSDQFMLTYGDGVADINIDSLIKCHNKMKIEKNTIATITVHKPISKYGIVYLENGIIKSFKEKPLSDNFVNIGFMVFEKEVLDYITEKDIMLEGDNGSILPLLASMNKLACYVHNGFWESMDTYKDYLTLNKLWTASRPWAIWEKH